MAAQHPQHVFRKRLEAEPLKEKTDIMAPIRVRDKASDIVEKMREKGIELTRFHILHEKEGFTVESYHPPYDRPRISVVDRFEEKEWGAKGGEVHTIEIYGQKVSIKVLEKIAKKL